MNWKLIFIFLTNFYSLAQGDFAFRNYSVESGLPSNSVYEAFQDEKGYIFIGHNKGVSIFNGVSFQVPNCESKTSALSNFISFSNGQLMCRNFQGKQFVFKNNKLTLFESTLKESWGFPTYLEDGDKHYIFQSKCFYTLDEKGKGNKINLPLDVSRIYHGVVLNDKAYLFVGATSVSKLICFDLKRNKLISSRAFDHKSSVNVFKTDKGIVWIDDRTGASGIYDNGFIEIMNLYSSILPKDSKITDFCELKNGDKLLSTFNGVYRLDNNWQFKNHYLNGIQCTHLLIDKDNALWVSSLQNGLFYISNTDIIQVNATSVSGRNVKFSKLLSHENFMYVGTYDGRILKFNSKGELTKTFDFKRSVEIQSIHISNNVMYAYCGGLLIVDLYSGAIIKEWALSACKSIFVKDKQVILGSSKGLLLYENGEFSTELDTLWVKKAFPFGENSFLLECAENIQIYNRTKRKLTELYFEGSDVCYLEGNYYFRSRNTVYEIIDQSTIRKIYSNVVDITHLYVADRKLIVHLENQKTIQLSGANFSRQKELQQCGLNDLSFCDEVGQYRINGNNSSIQLIPLDQAFNAPSPTVELVSEKGGTKKRNASYSLPYGDNELSLEFDILPNYHFSRQGSLYYRIVELDKDWKLAQRKDHYLIELLRLPSGDYTLEMYAESGGVQSQIQYYKLGIDQPFYFQWWFIVLFFGVIIVLTYGVIRWRSKLANMKNQRFMKEQELKMKALNSELVAIRSQMNPHFIFNSLSSIQTKILNEDRVEAYKNVNTFATLLRQALQFTSKEFITLQEEMEFTRNYISLEQTRTADAFDYVERIDSNLDLKNCAIPALFLQPFIENSIRHGLMHSKKTKSLQLSIFKKDSGFVAVIEDNGIGRMASASINEVQRPNHNSFASKAIEDRIDILRETKKMIIDLKIDDLEHGTIVTLNFQAI